MHPEVSFRQWNDGTAIMLPKKSRSGQAVRQRLICTRFGPDAFRNIRGQYLVRNVGHDDIADAFAALWTADRKLRGQAICIPQNPPTDEFGLRMEMWY